MSNTSAVKTERINRLSRLLLPEVSGNIDALEFLDAVLSLLQDGTIDKKEAIREIVLYMVMVRFPRLAGFFRNVVVQQMDGREFEHFIGLAFVLRGYEVEFTAGTGDHGVDVIAKKGDERIAIQCKHWGKPESVGPSIIREAFGSKAFYDCTEVVIATTSTLTKQAEEEANKLGVKIWDRTSIEKLTLEFLADLDCDQAGALLEQFLADRAAQQAAGKRLVRVINAQTRSVQDKVLEIISRYRAISHRRLVQLCWRYGNSRDIKSAVQALKKDGWVTVANEGARGGVVYHYSGDE